jgi:hypothetical protein
MQQLTYEHICDYYVVRVRGDSDGGYIRSGCRPEARTVGPVMPYPACQSTSWGPRPGPDGRRLKPLLKGSVFRCNEAGIAELRYDVMP